MRRKRIPDRTKLAALICLSLEIPHEIAKTMTEKEVLTLVEWDHWPIRHADGGPDAHWNLRPLLRPDHKVKTKHDQADMAKERKVRRAVDAHTQRMLLKRPGRKPKKQSRWPTRPFPKPEPVKGVF